MVFDHPKFTATITVEKATRIPYNSGSLFVRWNVTESPRPDSHGRTTSQRLKGTEALFDHETQFRQRIGIRNNSRYLRTCPIKFELVWEAQNSRGITIGSLNLDLSQFVRAKQGHHYHHPIQTLVEGETSPNQDDNPAAPSQNKATPTEAYDKSLLYLLEGARTNTLLGLRIRLDYVRGGSDYKIPTFDGPAVNFGTHGVAPELAGDGEDENSGSKGETSREKLRKLRDDVFDDLKRSEAHKMDLSSDWLDIDQFIQGNKVRAIPQKAFDDLHRKGIYDPSDYDIENHKQGTPYLETEIQEHFITWNIL